MSNLTVGKIVNNSVTLILSSADQDGFGEKIFTGNNFTMTTAETPAGRYKVKTGETEANTHNTVFTTTFDYLIRGDNLTDTITKNTFVAGKYYVVTDDPQVDGGQSTARSIFGIAHAEPELEPGSAPEPEPEPPLIVQAYDAGSPDFY